MSVKGLKISKIIGKREERDGRLWYRRRGKNRCVNRRMKIMTS